MTDYKRLCNELLSYLYQCNWPDAKRFYVLVERARAALAEPEIPSESPTDEELMKLAAEALGYECISVDGHETEGSALEAYGSELLAFARAVLARWGQPS